MIPSRIGGGMYDVGGRKMPGVTTVCGVGQRRFGSEYHMHRGTYVHSAAALILSGEELDTGHLGADEQYWWDECRPYIEGFQLFVKETGFVVHGDDIELLVYSLEDGIVGTLDFVGEMTKVEKQYRGQGVFDLKTLGSGLQLDKSIRPQTAAYALAYKKMRGLTRLPKRFGVPVSGAGKYDFKMLSDPTDINVFRAHQIVYNWQNTT